MILFSKYTYTPAVYDKWFNVWKATIFIAVVDSQKMVSHVYGSTEYEANSRARHFAELSNNHAENSEGFKMIFDALTEIEKLANPVEKIDKGYYADSIFRLVSDTLRKLNVERAEER